MIPRDASDPPPADFRGLLLALRGRAGLTQRELAALLGLSGRAIAKYGRADDAKTIDAVYKYALDYVDKIPYNTREGIQEVLKQAAERNPKAKDAKPESFYDDRFIKELDSQGFYKQLWKQ